LARLQDGRSIVEPRLMRWHPRGAGRRTNDPFRGVRRRAGRPRIPADRLLADGASERCAISRKAQRRHRRLDWKLRAKDKEERNQSGLDILRSCGGTARSAGRLLSRLPAEASRAVARDGGASIRRQDPRRAILALGFADRRGRQAPADAARHDALPAGPADLEARNCAAPSGRRRCSLTVLDVTSCPASRQACHDVTYRAITTRCHRFRVHRRQTGEERLSHQRALPRQTHPQTSSRQSMLAIAEIENFLGFG